MKILHVGDMAGVAYKLIDLLGNNATLICCDNTDWWQSPRALRLPYHGTISNLPVWLRVLAAQADVLHGHALLSILLPWCNTPYVCHVHGSDAREVATANTWRGKLLRYAWRHASRVYYVNPDLQPIIQQAGVNLDRMTHLPNPVNEQSFRSHQKKYTNDKINVLYPGPVADVIRNFDTFLAAWLQIAPTIPSLYLYLIHLPYDDPHRLTRVLATIQAANLQNRVTVLDAVPNHAMATVYNNMDIIVDHFNPHTPIISQCLVEAMMCERLVISATHPQLYWHGAPICPGGTAIEIEDSLRGLLAARSQWAHWGTKSRAWAIAHHGYQTVNTVLRRGYYEALHPKNCDR